MTSDHVRRNRAWWNAHAASFVAAGEVAWERDVPRWGIWGVPESTLHLLPDDVAGMDAIELGCGTAYVSAWLTRRGARVVALDPSEAQLATARRLQRRHGVDFALLHANAEAVPCCDERFDLAVPSTARACGRTRRAGSRRRRACSVPADASCSSSTRS